MLNGQERERLARALWDAYGAVLCNAGHIPPGAVASWNAQSDRVRDNYLMGAEAAAKVLLPEGTIAVDMDRAERLRLWAEFGHWIALRGVLPHRYGALVPQTSLVPGDLDLLSDPAGGEGGGG